MTYSPLIQEAIEVALRAHRGQLRKIREVPYIVHPLAVALLVSRAGGTDEQVASAILHDTVEDSSGEDKITPSFLEEKFGAKVATLVEELTEREKSIPWQERKDEMRERLAHASREAALVKAADLLHNLTEKRRAWKELGEETFSYFAVSKEAQMESHGKTIRALEKAWQENPLLPELKEVYGRFREEVLGKLSVVQ